MKNITEKQFLEQYSSEQYKKPSVAVDLVLFTIDGDELKCALIKRSEHPFKNMLSLPGVFVGINESLDDAVRRGIKTKAGLKDIYFEQLYTWGEVDRDPRMRIISVSYLALVPIEKLETTAALYPYEEIQKAELAFDHKKIVEYARERIKNKANYSDIAFKFLPEEFTLPQLQKIYEILLDKPLYKANFRKKIEPYIEDTGKMTSGNAHRPSKLYKRNEAII
ncbi:MAG: NUDIX hydrolase [Firmicutes bacterium]|nr:NUDIX hydrolase [Bacillota bacterium]